MQASSRSLVVAITKEGKASRWQHALQLLELHGATNDAFALSAAIGACGRGAAWPAALWLLMTLRRKKVTGGQLEGEGIEGIDMAQAFGGAINASRRWDLGLALLKEMARDVLQGNIIIYSILMSTCNRQQQWIKALEVFQEAMHLQLRSDAMCYGAAVSACEKGQQWTSALWLLDEMHRKEVIPNVITCNAAMAACGLPCAWPSALHLLEEVDLLGVTDVGSLESALCACGKGYAWQSCLLLLKDLEVRRWPVSQVAYGAAIHGQEGQWQQAVALFEGMAFNEVECNVIIYSALSRVCASASQWQRALSVFEEMRSSWVEGNVIAFSTAIAACEKGDRWQIILTLLEQMLKDDLCPNSVTLSTVIAAMNHQGHWELALLLMTEFRTPVDNVAVFNAAMDAVGQGLQWQMICELLEEMHETKVERDVITYSAAMSGMEQGLQWQRALQLFDDLLKSQMRLDALCLNAAINACKKEGRWQESLSLMHQMEVLVGCLPDHNSLAAVAAACEKASAWPSILQVFEETDMGFTADSLHAIRSAIVACSRGGCWLGAWTMLEALLEQGLDPGASSIAVEDFWHRPQAQRIFEALPRCSVQSLRSAATPAWPRPTSLRES